MFSVGVSARCTLKFQASIVGKWSGLLRAFGLTAYPCAGRRPLDGVVGNTYACGPWSKVNANPVVFGAVRLWFARTGRFCVTTWPKIDPKTPVSKLRP